jgi:sarcosine oxidase subunit beta
MTERLAVDVGIIGGGTAACAAAVALREAGLTVALLEKRLCGAGASGVNFGGVRQQGRHLAELPLARRARTLWDDLNRMLGEDVEFEATGHIKLARSEADMAELERYAESASMDLT